MKPPKHELIHCLICCFSKQCDKCSYNDLDVNRCKHRLVDDVISEVYNCGTRKDI